MTERALRYHDVQAMTGMGRSTVWRRVREGEFPPPRRVGAVTFWLESEVVEWLRSQPIAYGARVAAKRVSGRQTSDLPPAA